MPDENAAADGEVVWSWRRDPGVYPARQCGLGNGDNKGRSPRRSRISRKTTRAGKAGVIGGTCSGLTRVLVSFGHGAMGAFGARLSLRPLPQERDNEMDNPGESEPRECSALFEI